jgi:hypothetical protein
MAARSPVESDLWWHLRAGEETWESARPVLEDTFSHTRPGLTWINHSWLSQVGLYLLYSSGGYLGLSAAISLLAAFSLLFVYLQMEAPPLFRAFIVVLAGVVAAPVWSARPQLTSLVLFSLVAYLLYLYKWKQEDYLWLIIPVFVLWSNLHGGYILGLLLITSMIVGETLNHLQGYQEKETLPWKLIARLGFWLIAGGLVVVINPNGAAMWAIPLKTVGVSAVQNLISEWSSPDFHQIAQQPFVWMLLITFASVGLSPKRLDGSDLISVVGFAYLALLARRNFGPFALIAAPVLARHSYAWFLDHQTRWQAWGQRWRKENTNLPQTHNTINILLVAGLVLVALMKVYLVSRPGIVEKFNQEVFPVQAASWIEANRPVGNIFNDYNWGGYLIWALRDVPVFVDGRTDLYDDDLLADYLRTWAGDAGWQETLDKFGVRTVLTEKGSGLARQLEQASAWSRKYADELAVIYVRDKEK